MLTEGLLDLSIGGLIIVTLILTHITIASVTIFLHRHQAHRALELHPVVSHFFRFWLWLTTGMVTREWVAVHRKHHVTCETEEDPHSPQVKGIRVVMWQGAELYKHEAEKGDTLARFSGGTPDDWLERRFYIPQRNVGLILMLIIDVLLFGVLGLTVWAVQMLWIPFWAAGVINGIGHYWGYRNFETRDAATNIVPIGILIGGEEFHNNHHAYASSAKLGNKWWELDIGWWYIKIMSWLRLATVKKLAPATRIQAGKSIVDIDTVRAVVRNRFHILSLYGRSVILPVLRDARRKAHVHDRRLLRRARRLLVREDIRWKPADTQLVTQVLDNSSTLKVVCEYKKQLQELWNRSLTEQEKRVHRLQDWCNRAEQTGIQALADFANMLRGYSLKAV